jgi:hypothetical protein
VSDDLDALEAELRGFRPRPTSPALWGRIAERLAEPVATPSLLRQRLALAGGLIAAGVALVVVLHVAGPPRRVAPVPPRQVANRTATPPSVRAYRQALARSPAALEALLDEQAVSATPAPSVTAFTTANRNFLTWRGDR